MSPELIQVGDRRDHVAAAVRRLDHRRVPGAGRHRGPGGRGAGRGAGRAAEADAGARSRPRTSRPTRRSSRARRPARDWRSTDPRDSAARSTTTARRWRSTRRSCRPGCSCPGRTPPSTTSARPPRPTTAALARRGEHAPATGAGTARDPARAGRLPAVRPGRRGRGARGVRGGAREGAGQRGPAERRRPRRAEPGTVGGVRRALHEGAAPSIPARRSTPGARASPCSGSGAIPRRTRPSIAGWRIAPSTLLLHSGKAMVRLAQGDLPGARDVIRKIAADVEPTAVVVEPGDVLGSVLGPRRATQQRLLLRLPPSAFDDDRGAWGIALAETYALRGDRARARAYADSAAAALRGADQGDAGRPAALRPARASRSPTSGARTRRSGEGKRALELAPITQGRLRRARTTSTSSRGSTSCVGEPDKALDQLEPLLKMPYYLSPGVAQDRSQRSIRCGRTRDSRSWWRARRDGRAPRAARRPASPTATRSSASSAAAAWPPSTSPRTSSTTARSRSRCSTPSWPPALGAERFQREIGSPPGCSTPTSSPCSTRARPAGPPLVHHAVHRGREPARPAPARAASSRSATRSGSRARRPARSTTRTGTGVVHRDIKPENILLRGRPGAGGRLRHRPRARRRRRSS